MSRPACWHQVVNLEDLPEPVRNLYSLCRCRKARYLLAELLHEFHLDGSQPHQMQYVEALILPHKLDIVCPTCNDTGLVPVESLKRLWRLDELLEQRKSNR
jgi:hypothetical protein